MNDYYLIGFLLIFACIFGIGVVSADHSTYRIVDISQAMNAGFTPNPMGSDQKDFRWVVPGIHKYTVEGNEVPFSIENPLNNNGNGIVISKGGAPGSSAYPYHTVFEFPVPADFQQHVSHVHLLGLASGWGTDTYGSKGTVGGSLTFIYSDNSAFTQPIRQGIEYDDWSSSHFSTKTTFGESGLSSAGSYTHFDILTIDLPEKSAEKLERIRFEDSGSITAIPIFAITLESNQQPVIITDETPVSEPLPRVIEVKDIGFAFLIAVIGILGGFLGNLIASTYGRWRQSEQHGTQSSTDLRNEFIIELVFLGIMVIIGGWLITQ
jgi:hypothetical protein